MRAASPYFRTVIPEILNDSQRLLQPWEKAGTLDPFDTIYEVGRLLSPLTPTAPSRFTSGGGTCRKTGRPSGGDVITPSSCKLLLQER